MFLDKHALKMQKQRAIIGLTAIIIDKKGNSYEVPCSATNIKADDIQANQYLDKKSIKLKILVVDLKEAKAPITASAYDEIKYKMTRYKVVDHGIIGGFDDTLSLYGVLYG
jgi:hypothetical protein